MRRRTPLAAVLSLTVCLPLAACSGTGTASNGGYPTSHITVIVGTSAGGPTDMVARVVAGCMEKDLGRTLVVQNVEGASGAVANRKLIAAKPDGYTIAFTPATGLTLSPFLDDLGFSVDDVTPIASVFRTSMIFVTSPDSSFTTGKAFVQAARQNPGKYSVGTPGPTSPKSVVLDALADEYGVKLNAVPLQGQAGVVAAILGKNVDVAAVEATDDVKELVAAGKVVPLAAIASERVTGLDNTPTLAELGLPKASLVDNVYPFFGPKGLTENVVSRLEGGVRNCLADPGVVDKIGKDYVTEPFQGAAATTKFMTDSAQLYHGIVSG